MALLLPSYSSLGNPIVLDDQPAKDLKEADAFYGPDCSQYKRPKLRDASVPPRPLSSIPKYNFTPHSPKAKKRRLLTLPSRLKEAQLKRRLTAFIRNQRRLGHGTPSLRDQCALISSEYASKYRRYKEKNGIPEVQTVLVYPWLPAREFLSCEIAELKQKWKRKQRKAVLLKDM
jgi:hypothetical protein